MELSRATIAACKRRLRLGPPGRKAFPGHGRVERDCEQGSLLVAHLGDDDLRPAGLVDSALELDHGAKRDQPQHQIPARTSVARP